MAITFHDALLPEYMTANAQGGAEFATADIRSGLGGSVLFTGVLREDYISRYTIPFARLTESRMRELRTFFILRKGKAYAFRFKAPDDYTMTNERVGKLNAGTGEIDQSTNTDGSTTVYYFIKYYSDPGAAYVRRIVKPSPVDAGSFVVTNTSDVVQETVPFGSLAAPLGAIPDSEVIATATFGNVTIDYTQGKLTLTTAVANKRIYLTNTFHLPVRFLSDFPNFNFDLGATSDLSIEMEEILPVSLGFV